MADGSHREIVAIGDPDSPNTGAIAKVTNSTPPDNAYGMVVRQVPPCNPTIERVVGLLPTARGSIDLDSTALPAGAVAHLVLVVMSCSLPCKWTISKVVGAVESPVTDYYTGGLLGRPTERFEIPKGFVSVTLLGSHFRVTVTGLDDKAPDNVTASVTFIYDEVV
jgi:hypothetical protein